MSFCACYFFMNLIFCILEYGSAVPPGSAAVVEIPLDVPVKLEAPGDGEEVPTGPPPAASTSGAAEDPSPPRRTVYRKANVAANTPGPRTSDDELQIIPTGN